MVPLGGHLHGVLRSFLAGGSIHSRTLTRAHDDDRLQNQPLHGTRGDRAPVRGAVGTER